MPDYGRAALSKVNDLTKNTDKQIANVFDKMGTYKNFNLTTGALRDGNIVTIGDSITAGQGGSRNYPYWLTATIQRLNINNVGVGGVKIAYHIDNQNAYLSLTPKPKLAIVLIGTNDLQPDGTIDQMKTDYKQLISILTTNNITPVLCTLLPRSDFPALKTNLLKFNEFIREYGRINGFTVIDTYIAFSNSDGTPKAGYLSTDNLHPTTFGYMKLVEEIAPKLPLSLKEVQWSIPGTTNIINNPTFSVDANNDGRADSWLSFAQSGITTTYSLVPHPIDGNWQQVTKSGGTDANSITYLYETLTLPAGIAVGDTILYEIDVDTDESINGEVEVSGQWLTSADAFISSTTILSKTATQIKSKRFSKAFVVPSTAAKIKILLSIYGNGNATVRYGRVLFKRYESI